MAMHEFPLLVFQSENARYSQSHGPNLLRPGQADFGAFNINRVRHFRCDDGRDIFGAALIVVSGKPR